MKKNYFYLFFFFKYFNAYMPYIGIFLLNNKNCSNADILQFFAIYSTAIVLLEIPTGTFSDKIGERKSLLLGSILRFCAILFLIYGNGYLIFFSQILFAAGDAFLSGCDHSLLYQYCQNEKDSLEKNGSSYDSIVANVNILSWSAIALAALCGFLVSTYDIAYPFWITFLAFSINIIVVYFLPKSEHIREKKAVDIIGKTMQVLKNSYNLKSWFFYTSILMSMLSCSYLLFQPLLNIRKLAGASNGIVFFIITLMAIMGSFVGKKIIGKNTIWTPILIAIGLCVSIVFVGQVNNIFLLVTLFALLRFIWGISEVYFMRNINLNITTDSLRSTILSLKSLLESSLTSSLLFILSIVNIDINYHYISIGIIVVVVSLIFIGRNFLRENRNGRTTWSCN